MSSPAQHRRRFLSAFLVGAFALGSAPIAAQEILVRLGDSSTPTTLAAGSQIEVPVVVDLSGTTKSVGSVSVLMTWDPSVFTYVSSSAGSFGSTTINDSEAGNGELQAGSFSANGTSSTFTLATVTLEAVASEGTNAALGVAVTAIGDASGNDISNVTGSRGLQICIGGGGTWGDVNGDGAVNIIDAQQVARYAVGLSVADQPTLEAVGDVNEDGAVNIIDAQQIARYSVGLETSSSRVGESLPGGSCTEASFDELRITPQSAQVGIGATTTFVVGAYRNGSAVDWPGGTVSWQSSNSSIFTVSGVDDVTAEVTGAAEGTARLIGSLGGVSVAAGVVVSDRPCASIPDFQVGSVGMPGMVSSELTDEDCRFESGHFAEAWELTIDASQDVQIDLASSEFDAMLGLVNSHGDWVATDDDGGSGYDSRIVETLEPGTYYIFASTFAAGEVGAYELSLSTPTDPGELQCQFPDDYEVGSVAVGQTVSGALADGDCLDAEAYYTEAWVVQLTSSQQVQLDLRSGAFDAYLFLLDEAGEFVDHDNDSGSGTNARMTVDLPAGTYYVMASTWSAMETGEYTLELSTGGSEPSDPECSTVAEFLVGTVALNSTEAGTLDAQDCALGNGRYAEAWELELSSTTTVQLDLESAEFDTYLQVLNSNGSWVATDDDGGEGLNSHLVQTFEAGTYYVFATSYGAGEVGGYTLSVTEGTTPAECTELSQFLVGTVAMGETVSGSLDENDCLDGGTWYTEGWTLQLGATQTVQLDLMSGDFDAYLFLLDESGSWLAGRDDGGEGTDARLTLTLEAGTYHVMASTWFEREMGAYTLSVAEGEMPACSTLDEFLVGTVALNTSETGLLESTDCALSNGTHAEAWQLDLTSSTTVQIDLESNEFDTYLRVMNANGTWVAIDDDGGDGLNSRLIETFGAGTYYVFATTYSAGETGAYTLSVAEGEFTECSTVGEFLVGTIGVGETVSSSLDESDCLLGGYYYTEGWTLELEAGQALQIDHSSPDFAPWVVVLDGSGNYVTDNFGSSAGTTARVALELPAGTYHILASTWYELVTGAYELSVEPTELTYCETVSEFLVGTAELGASYTGELDSADCHFESGHYAEAWQLDVTEATTVGVDLESDEFDAYLGILDDQGNWLAIDDDGGDGLNSRIVQSLDPGTYYVFATSFSAWETGAYTLTLAEGQIESCSTMADFLVGSVAVGQTVSSALDEEDCLDGGYYTEGWTLDLAEGQAVQIDQVSSEFDALVYVLNEFGEYMGHNNDGGGGTDARLTLDLPAGTYHIFATSWSEFEMGAYTLSVIESGATFCDTVDQFVVGTTQVGASQNGELDSADCLFSSGHYAEAWQLDLSGATTVQIDLESAEFDTYLRILDDAGNWIAWNDDGGADLNSRIVETLEAGTYYVFTTTYSPGELGAYTLTVAEGELGGECTTISDFLVGSVAVGETVSSSLDESDCLDGGEWYTEGWTLDLPDGSGVQIDQMSSEFDAFFFVLDEAWTYIADDNDSGDGTNARRALDLPPGTYHIFASSWYAFETGAYTLSVVEAEVNACSTLDEFVVGDAAVNTTHSGTLDSADCQLGDGTYAEAWVLQVSGSVTLQLDMTSDQVDSYLFATDAEGYIVAEDDDSGGELNARITHTFGAGTYYIFANTFSPGETGTYNLQISN